MKFIKTKVGNLPTDVHEVIISYEEEHGERFYLNFVLRNQCLRHGIEAFRKNKREIHI